MAAIVDRLIQAVQRHRELPPSELARKIRDNVKALLLARLRLRSCTTVGARARAFGRRPDIRNEGTLRIGEDFAMSSVFGTVQLATAKHAVLEIGNDVTINYGTSVSARARVRIGDGSKIGPYCVIADSELPLPLDPPDADAPMPIEIGRNVWLGGRVTVLPGACIGDGAVISAGSVVAGVIPANAIASGVPARVLRIAAAHYSGTPPSGARLRAASSGGGVLPSDSANTT
ncbi:MAG: acyltransferase [Polyangiaceae bacterium]|nr:acyltransferase [Polyangiaceae bacterium]